VIVLAVDDIAHNSENPFPGQMFNKPTPAGTPGVDVYAGCAIDYKGSDVTPDTFTKVLTGQATNAGTGKVLRSTANDRVFVNFVDHGAVGIIGFPNSFMHANELVGALKTMHSNGMYKELVFYLEACESGSMFQDLPDDISIYATTASNGQESSWGTYCMPDDMIDGKEIRSCLGDLYSVNWMEDTDNHTAVSETLQTQFLTVKALTSRSHVIQFGDLSITAEKISAFEGNGDAIAATDSAVRAPKKLTASLASPDAALASAYHRFMATGSDVAAEELIRGVQERQQAKHRFDAITRTVTNGGLEALPAHDGNVDLKCHYEAHKAYVAACGDWTEGSAAYSKVFAQLCKHTGGDPVAITSAVGKACA